MRKFILILIMCCASIVTFAQTQWLKANGVSIKINGEWSEWVDCNVNIKVDFDNDAIIVYSNSIQKYVIIKEVTPPYDNLGEQVAFSVIDQDGDAGRLRIRRMYNGLKQLYVDFSDVSWVYNIE